ncbi:hypothetical protein BUALT_Bualt09G0088000 [Buddleja alternifolia]|uniref:Phytosulfokine n=1 Tax=Buddleja alternifolia TaxID=168488 RepID=A0AAV6X1M2_9LAMI|nr:hypothetical protein BUALT_Bualt09G0088000 [Buddleja alternifolia]
MKQISNATITSLFILLIISHTSARLLSSRQGDSSGTKGYEMTPEDNISSLMGLEECGEKDEGCVKRRMVADAHLDYIYTQHHNP